MERQALLVSYSSECHQSVTRTNSSKLWMVNDRQKMKKRDYDIRINKRWEFVQERNRISTVLYNFTTSTQQLSDYGIPLQRGRFLFALWTVICCFAMIVMPMSLRAQRETKSLNHDWKFLKGECTSAADSTFNDSQWANIHLPHTWNTDAYTEKDYYRGIGWYRHRITLPKNWKGKQVFLKLDAANKAATFFINGKT